MPSFRELSARIYKNRRINNLKLLKPKKLRIDYQIIEERIKTMNDEKRRKNRIKKTQRK
jgi:hypothetical protein